MPVHILPAGRLGGGPVGWLRAIGKIFTGRAMASRLYETFEPSAVIGFGGYPALPALMAAQRDRIPTLIHEQNAVLGRVNRIVSGRVDAIATAYPNVQRLARSREGKTHLVGNPVRDEVLALRDQPYPELTDEGVFRLLVTGGSQGATILSEVVPEGLGLLPEHFRRRLQVTQQCRAEDIEAVRARYAALGHRRRARHLHSRHAGQARLDPPRHRPRRRLDHRRADRRRPARRSSSRCPSATDDHQTANAREMAKAGGARTIAQKNFTPVELAKQMQKLGLEPAALANAAARARAVGRPNAASDLADLVEMTGRDLGSDPLPAEEMILTPIPSGAFA